MKRNPLEWLSETLLSITVIPVVVMMIHVTLDVILKYTGFKPIQGTLEITAYYYMVSIVVLPMAFVELTRQSIAVDLFYQMMGPRLQTAVTFFVLILCAAAYGGLGSIAWPDAMKALARHEIAMGSVNIYIWPARFILPIGLFVTMAVCLMLGIRLLVDPKARADLTAIHAVETDLEGN